ncbi:MAG TPA: hypothetical protein DEG43_15515 [Acidimicrobiaceae bacterium]|nr:hypothetical protein [Acidimicrobiaceae bacterium]
MRFLLDQNQSPKLVALLASAGHDTVHVGNLGLGEASDAEIFAVAAEQDRVIVSGDTDFGDLLAETNSLKPSVILLRRQDRRRAHQVAALLLANLGPVGADLDAGAVVVLDQDRVRVRRLPFQP